MNEEAKGRAIRGIVDVNHEECVLISDNVNSDNRGMGE